LLSKDQQNLQSSQFVCSACLFKGANPFSLDVIQCGNCLHVGLHALRRALGGSHQAASDQQLMGTVTVNLQDLQWAMSAVKPSAMREVAIDVPKVQ